MGHEAAHFGTAAVSWTVTRSTALLNWKATSARRPSGWAKTNCSPFRLKSFQREGSKNAKG